MFNSKNKKTVSTLVLATILSTALAGCSRTSHSETLSEKPDVPFTISNETTYITNPLWPDGYPNYIAALDRRYSKGVTPENNASVLLWKALGPGSIPKKGRKKFFQMLGIPALPDKGNYCVHCDDIIPISDATKSLDAQPAETDALLRADQLLEARKRPWSKHEFPAFAEILIANKKPFALVIEASKRSHFYMPMVVLDTTKNERHPFAWCAGVVKVRCCVKWLCMRSMLRLHENKIDMAWEDALACHRLARLVAQSPMSYSLLLGTYSEGCAMRAKLNIMRHAALTADQVAEMQRDIDCLPSIPTMAERFDFGDRLDWLAIICEIIRGGVHAQYLQHKKEIKELLQSWDYPATEAVVDWDIVLHGVNTWCNQAADAYRKTDRNERIKAIATIRTKMNKMMPAVTSTPAEDHSYAFLKAISSEIFMVLNAPGDLADIWATRSNLLKLALSLAAYRADHGSYPLELADLKPKYITDVPKDIFNNKNLHYTPQNDGYLLYSVGVNGEDDEGNSDGMGDDVIVRMGCPGP